VLSRLRSMRAGRYTLTLQIRRGRTTTVKRLQITIA
jgi:hypothetical protein